MIDIVGACLFGGAFSVAIGVLAYHYGYFEGLAEERLVQLEQLAPQSDAKDAAA